MDIKTLIERIKKFDQTVDEIIIEELRKRESEIVQNNVDQIFAGTRANDTEIRPGYAQKTITRKRRLSQPFDRVTLRDTGDFHESITIEYRQDEIELLSKGDDKSKHLERRYGKEIFGLNEENLKDLIEKTRNDLTERLKKMLK